MSRTYSVKDRSYGPLLRAANAAAGIADAVGLPFGRVEEKSVLDSARRATGLSDFGDPEFLVPMRRILEEARKAPMSPLGRVIIRQAFIQAASNRLKFEGYLKKHPEILDQKVERPIFVLGFPRTGTTVLQHLLCLDEGRRGLEFWELTNPVPVHEDPAIDARKRIRTASTVLKAAYTVAPEMGEVHYMSAQTLEECWPLFGNSYSVLNWDLQSGLKDYGSWLLDEYDMVHPYREYKRWLQLLSWRRPADNLVLKCPEHLWFIDALLEVFPDACIVWTHRDPYDTIASYCSLISMQYRALYGTFDPKAIGKHVTERFLDGIGRAMEARSRHDPARFYDMPFSHLIGDQRQSIEDICGYFELPYRAGADEAIEGWLAGRKQDARGKHKYSGDTYGLDRGLIHRRYADYIESFSVKVRAA